MSAAARRWVVMLAVAVAVVPGLGFAGADAAVPSAAPWVGMMHPPHLGHGTAGTFALVSNFEDQKADGWSATRGSFTVVARPSYDGEPALRASGTAASPATARASAGFVLGQTSISFQAALRGSSTSTGFIGFADAKAPVAVIGISRGMVWAGATPASAVAIGPVPTNSSQPTGWVYVLANLHRVVNGSHRVWRMDVFVDRTDLVAQRGVSVPNAGGYTSAWLGTSAGTVEYTDLVFTTYQIASHIPGYNNMDGYGQGSGLLVRVLPAFTTLSATMVLQNWSTPQTGILGIQINAMNYTGTVKSTCHGFFQLGVDIDPRGHISPWYVPGKVCVAHYFNHTGLWPGFVSPPGTRLSLVIADNVSNGSIDFTILDRSVAGGFSAWHDSIPYTGTEFFGTYTQIEWQPCCAKFPISAYRLNATVDHLSIAGGNLSAPVGLPASYMIPFNVDLPPSWNLNYYNGAIAGYDQVG
ncbi:MAG TPA: hypothetical protein VGV89_10850 [Thermoplasmata archaeon]|nr:hypothetical protein [Thermoplasmata archaeon]